MKNKEIINFLKESVKIIPITVFIGLGLYYLYYFGNAITTTNLILCFILFLMRSSLPLKQCGLRLQSHYQYSWCMHQLGEG